VDKDVIFKQNAGLALSPGDRAVFLEKVVIQRVEESSYFIMPGDRSLYLPYVVRGTFKVYKLAENGREIILYRIEDGQSCILSALSIINGTLFPATVESERDSDVLLVPAELLKYLVDRYPGWRNYIFAMYNSRFDTMLALIDELLFRKLDIRLAEFLLKRGNRSGFIEMTHQQIADELGSRREVISRLLKDFESGGMVELGRGRISIKDPSKLTKKASLV